MGAQFCPVSYIFMDDNPQENIFAFISFAAAHTKYVLKSMSALSEGAFVKGVKDICTSQ